MRANESLLIESKLIPINWENILLNSDLGAMITFAKDAQCVPPSSNGDRQLTQAMATVIEHHVAGGNRTLPAAQHHSQITSLTVSTTTVKLNTGLVTIVFNNEPVAAISDQLCSFSLKGKQVESSR
jgi:hypothetical protein